MQTVADAPADLAGFDGPELYRQLKFHEAAAEARRLELVRRESVAKAEMARWHAAERERAEAEQTEWQRLSRAAAEAEARAADGEVHFAHFRDRLAGRRGGGLGFPALAARYGLDVGLARAAGPAQVQALRDAVARLKDAAEQAAEALAQNPKEQARRAVEAEAREAAARDASYRAAEAETILGITL